MVRVLRALTTVRILFCMAFLISSEALLGAPDSALSSSVSTLQTVKDVEVETGRDRPKMF